ncbi:MAG TPA: cory-CC-star protein [Longimicrobiales bacterium]|nr:cory-CC-star protein [Longimicrobiales bacterium]
MRRLRRLLRALRKLPRLYEEMAIAPYRREILRAQARQRDAFMVATLADALGVPSPIELYTLELLPYLMEDFHAWHRRAGLERAPEGGWRCC